VANCFYLRICGFFILISLGLISRSSAWIFLATDSQIKKDY
jgi:hypothetical protein